MAKKQFNLADISWFRSHTEKSLNIRSDLLQLLPGVISSKKQEHFIHNIGSQPE